MPLTSGAIFEGLAAVGTLGAAFFAAISAWVSSKSARAAEEAVNEARLARKAELAPRLVMEKDFADLYLVWPSPRTWESGVAHLATRSSPTDHVTPRFIIKNHGGGPALDIQVVFELDDPNGELSVPSLHDEFGIKLSNPSEDDWPLSLNLPIDEGWVGTPLYRVWTTDLHNCAPGQTRSIDFPSFLLTRTFLRGLQSLERKKKGGRIENMTLTVSITSHAMDGEAYRTQFRFAVWPSSRSIEPPFEVSGSVMEMPMYPREQPKVVV